jgi:hypothetical protein
MTELKPCPFCGYHSVGDAGFWRHCIKCHTCGAKTLPCSNWYEAVNCWNTRSFTPAQKHSEELLEALNYVLLQLRLAFMGFGSINLDVNKLQTLYDAIARENSDDLLS